VVDFPLPVGPVTSINPFGFFMSSLSVPGRLRSSSFGIDTGICLIEKGLLNYDRFKLKIPFIGQILLKISMSRFANMFENMVRTGVPIIRTFEIVARTVGNQYIANKIVEIGLKVEKGKGITKPMKEAQIFPPLVMHMMSTGEDTGSLEEMLGEITRHYDREITYSIGRLSSWIEPILTAGLSIMVLFLALAIFLPWWNMMGAMKGGGP